MGVQWCQGVSVCQGVVAWRSYWACPAGVSRLQMFGDDKGSAGIPLTMLLTALPVHCGLVMKLLVIYYNSSVPRHLWRIGYFFSLLQLYISRWLFLPFSS